MSGLAAIVTYNSGKINGNMMSGDFCIKTALQDILFFHKKSEGR